MAVNLENMNEDPSIFGGDHTYCFICWRGTRDRLKLEPVVPPKSPPHHLNSSLSVIFLLRKVLGLPQNVLITLLGNCGRGGGGDNPADWGIKLCISCSAIFKEAHFLYRRLIKIQADFQEVAKLLRDTLVDSQSTQENENEETEATMHLEKRTRRRPGRPASKKSRTQDPEITGNVELDVKTKMEDTCHPVSCLRTKFIERKSIKNYFILT